MVTRFATTCETAKYEAMLSRHPEGEDDANVALTTKTMAMMVMYHRLAVDQFLGFSMSFGEKSRSPVLSFTVMPESRTFPERYGLAAGRERTRSRASILVGFERKRVVMETMKNSHESRVRVSE